LSKYAAAIVPDRDFPAKSPLRNISPRPWWAHAPHTALAFVKPSDEKSTVKNSRPVLLRGAGVSASTHPPLAGGTAETHSSVESGASKTGWQVLTGILCCLRRDRSQPRRLRRHLAHLPHLQKAYMQRILQSST